MGKECNTCARLLLLLPLKHKNRKIRGELKGENSRVIMPLMYNATNVYDSGGGSIVENVVSEPVLHIFPGQV